MEKGKDSVFRKVLFIIILVYLIIYYTHLDVLEFHLNGTRLKLPCTVDDIRECGYRVDESSGDCDYNDLGLGTLHITQDENGMVYEIYTEDVFSDLEIYGKIDMRGMRKSLKEFDDKLAKAYGEPAEENNKSKTYIKYKNETEYAYIIITDYHISRIGIVSDKPLSSN